jgi:hypothetical protein
VRKPDKADDIRSDDDIIADIVQACGGSNPTIKGHVDELFAGVRELAKYPFPLAGYRRDNEKFVRKVRKWIEDGEGLLSAAPDGFNFHMLFAPEKSRSIDAMLQEAGQRYGTLAAILAGVRDRCSWMAETKIGEHRSSGFPQERAAIAAGELMKRCGLPLAYSSRTSPYRVVASLFFEAMTGEYDRDMERACEAMADGTIRTGK